MTPPATAAEAGRPVDLFEDSLTPRRSIVRSAERAVCQPSKLPNGATQFCVDDGRARVWNLPEVATTQFPRWYSNADTRVVDVVVAGTNETCEGVVIGFSEPSGTCTASVYCTRRLQIVTFSCLNFRRKIRDVFNVGMIKKTRSTNMT